MDVDERPDNEAARQRRPLGITLLASFSVLAGIISITSAASLLAPGSWLEPMWSVNPRARAAFTSMGPWAAVLLTIVSVSCFASAVGLWRRRLWGYRLAIAALAVNMTGDLINGLARDPRSLVGVPIVSALLVYLLRPAIRKSFRRR